MIDSVLRSKNGEGGYGFLHRPEFYDEEGAAIFLNDSAQATAEVIWQNRLDRRYDVMVLASTKPYVGVFVVRDGNTELCRRTVNLSYNAVVGPDVADVSAWEDAAITLIDRSKPPEQRLAEAIAHIDKDRSARLRRLRRAPQGPKAYDLARKALRYPEVAVDWLISPNAALNRKAPVDLLGDEDGLERIGEILDNFMSTIYPLS